ncbi:hypothetical protein RUM43_001940 [Polyplax serrata]|uniref:Vitellogenin domain-containing protein n=1 Tax=Polyplax serrata TaxID=468196 RepID=A0AAN8SF64_POLSC
MASLFRRTSENRSTLYVKALVHLSFLSPCQGKIRVTDVILSEEKLNGFDSEENLYHPNSENFAESIAKHPLRFSFSDGNIEEICPHESEPVWVLNFKRGILSSFHTTMTRFDVDHDSIETDVNGHCQTRYRLQAAKGTTLLIHKTKKLDTCDSRNGYHTIVQANRYRFGSDFQTIPLVNSRQKCEFSIDHKIYSEIECEEMHTFQPFSKDEDGSQTIIRQSFQLVSENRENSTAPELIKRRTNLLFDHTTTPKPTSGELKTSRDLIKLMCQLNADDVQDGYAEAFTKFIQTARRLSHSALSLIYQRAGSICSTGRKHVTDAFPYLGSNVAVTIMKEAILQNTVSDSTAHEWLLSLSFIPHPDEETIELVVPLINHSRTKNESQYLFSISSLIHTYCKHNSSCEKNENVQMFLHHLEKKVNAGCSQGKLNRTSQTEILIVLKSLGNIGLTTENLKSKLVECVENNEINVDVRVAAIQSHRRLACAHSRDYYLDLYRNTTYDTELRIASYLEVMRCPNYFVTTVVRKALEEEEVNQVGSFVWSHLHNLLKSSALNKVEIQSLLMDKNLSEKFNMDRRKFSRNYEHSIFLDEYNVGGNVESNIIFSPKSYLPRSGMLNVTVDLFGRSVNVLEVDTRLEGFEHVLEYAFGPRGPFSATEVGGKLEKLSRMIRDVSGSGKIQPEKEFPNVIDNNFKLPKLSFGVKIFGNEISYTDVVGHPEFNDLLDKINPELRIRQILSGKEINFNKAGMFLDADYNVPTGIGFPLTLAATGTAAVSLNVAGNIKSLHILALDVKGKLQPSVAIDVTGQMGIDAYYASTGTKLKTSLHSSTAVDGHIKVEGTNFAKVTFNLPREKADIIAVQTELIVMKNDNEEVQSGITENRVAEKVCSWPTLDHTLGLKLCTDIVFPNVTTFPDDDNFDLKLLSKRKSDKVPWFSFMFNGPAKFAMALYKADPTAKEYALQYNWVQKEETTTISLVYDTPHSQQKRELSARLLLNKSSRNLTLLLRAVDNKFEAYGKYKYTPTEKYLDFSLDVNGKKQFIAQVGLRTKEIKYGFIYQPKLYLAVNQERIAELSGTVKIMEKNEINQCDVNLEFKTKKLSTKLFGYISRGSSSFSADLKLSYHFSTPEYVRVTLKWVNKSSKNLIQFNGEFSLDTSAYKHFNFESILKYQRAQGHAECTIEINTQPHLKDDVHKFTIKFVFSLSKNFNRTKLHTFVEITKPISHIDLKLELKVDINHHGHDDKSTTIFTLKYATGKEIVATLDLFLPRSEMFKMDAKLNVTLPSFVPMIFTTKIEEKKSREYDLEASVTWFNGHNLTAKGIYVDKSEGVVTSHSIKLFLQSPSFNDIAFIGKFLMDDVQFKLDLQADHNNEKYSVLLKHSVQSPLELDLYGEVRYRTSVYSLTTIVNLMKQRQVLVELHLDQYRDIHLTLNGVNIPTHKQAGIEVKWDANRDPSQRFEALVKFQHPRSLNYSTEFSVSYPGRLIKGNALFAVYGTRFDSSASMEWNKNEMIDIKVGAVYENQKGKSLKVTSQLLTPFAGWKRTSLTTGIHKENNQLRLNGTVWWQDNQTVSLDIFGDYELLKKKSQEDEDYSDFDILLRPDLPDLWVEFSASLISTVDEVKPVSAAFKHKQNNNCFNTVVHLKGQTNQLISINSSWELSPGPNSTNITGTILLVSPYKGYEKGVLVGRLYYTIDLDIHGVAELDLDKKKYGATIDGYIKSIRDNKFIIDVNTPIELYSKITGKLGYSEVHRHLMCIWESPSNSIGFEILFDFRHASNFDLKFLVATPFEFFSRLLLRGKLVTQMADIKIGLNNLLLGFEGYWRYESLYDLDYKYVLYTPLEGFKENGVIARIIYEKNIDVELSLKVAELKVLLSSFYFAYVIFPRCNDFEFWGPSLS